MKSGVIGYPIKHSKSPIIHGYWLKKYNVLGEYKQIEIAPNDLEKDIQYLIDNNFDGFNVTLPHKEKLYDLCDEIDDIAKKIGAVNTVHIENKKLFGTNTDAFGFVQNIKQNSNFKFEQKTAFILGAGGAARALIYGLVEENIEKIYLTNRTQSRALTLKKMAPDIIEIIDWEDKENILPDTDLLINATSLGMAGKGALSLDLNNLKPAAVVTDIVYTPLMTPLLLDAQAGGYDVVTGIGMLLHQARPSFQAWTGIMPDVTPQLQELILR